MSPQKNLVLLFPMILHLPVLGTLKVLNVSQCIFLIIGITSKNIQLVELVENLGPFLLHLDNDKREQGCLVLANILTLLPHDALSSMEVTFIARFLCERMKDHHSVIPAALKGTLAIVSLTSDFAPASFSHFFTIFFFFCKYRIN